MAAGANLCHFFIKWRSLDYFLKIFTAFLICGTIVYDMFWFKAFSDHDYYQLANVIAPVFLTITIAEYVDRKQFVGTAVYQRYIFSGALFIVMLLSIFHNRNVQRYRYSDPAFAGPNPAIYEAVPFLRKIGVAATDTIISAPDATPNISLTAFRNRGYTTEFSNRIFNVASCRRHGAKYLVITDSNYIHNSFYEAYTTKLMGVYKGIFVYDLR